MSARPDPWTDPGTVDHLGEWMPGKDDTSLFCIVAPPPGYWVPNKDSISVHNSMPVTRDGKMLYNGLFWDGTTIVIEAKREGT